MQLPGIPPALALIVVLSIIYGTLFHLWRGRTWSDLIAAMVISLLGMIIGQLIAPVLGLEIGRIGQVYILEGTVLAWALMLASLLLKG